VLRDLVDGGAAGGVEELADLLEAASGGGGAFVLAPRHVRSSMLWRAQQIKKIMVEAESEHAMRTWDKVWAFGAGSITAIVLYVVLAYLGWLP